MNKRGSRFVLACVLSLTTAASACVSGTSDGARRPTVSMENGAVVLTGAALHDGRGSVLDAMAGKVPNFRFRRVAQQCPLIALRGAASTTSITGPHVYVDGSRSTDTCILETLSTRDVERVEVYPQGYTTRPGYGRNANGLILLFMRSG